MMKTIVTLVVAAQLLLVPSALAAPPGVVVDHIPAATRSYIGSPSITILPNGEYVASHDFFGPGSTNDRSAIFGSADRGVTWHKLAELEGQWWSTLFVHRDALYILGTSKEYGNIVIRRSSDGGRTWTRPAISTSGLLREDGQYHCAPTPVITHNGRLWRAFEHRDPAKGWAVTFRAGMLSVPLDADLLQAASWASSNFVPSDTNWLNGTFGGWLEGNAVVAEDGRLLDILRVDTAGYPEQAALVQISPDGHAASFDPKAGFIDFPGGAKKFTIRHDPKSDLYWSLADVVPKTYQSKVKPAGMRNTLALTSSPDLTRWTVCCVLLQNVDRTVHGFQYVDWQFDGDDIIAVCRTAYDDDGASAHSFHDANFLTFHRIANFRSKTMADSVKAEELRSETRDFIVTGRGWTVAKLADGERAFGNRPYVWQKVPQSFRNWRLTRTNGGEQCRLHVKARQNATLFVATTTAQKGVTLEGWTAVPEGAFCYTDRGRTPMNIYQRAIAAGDELEVPQGNWTGTLVLLPPDAAAAEPR